PLSLLSSARAPSCRRRRAPPRSTPSPSTTLFRSLAWLTAHRHLVRDYERHPGVAEEMVRWAVIGRMARSLTRGRDAVRQQAWTQDRKSTRLNSSHVSISYAVFCLKKKIKKRRAWP